MKPSEALMLPDEILAEMYSAWSEDTYCAGWMSDAEEEFAEWLINDSKHRRMADYETEGVAKIRQFLLKMLKEE